MKKPARVVVTGIGVVTPLGCDRETLWQRILAGESAARRWLDLEAEELPISVACRVGDFHDEPRGGAMAVAAARSAVSDAGWSVPPPDLGVFAGTTLGESRRFEEAAPRLPARETAAADAFPRAVASALDLAGPVRAYGTACAAGNYAIGAAAERIRLGRSRRMLAGGVEPFSRIAMVGFTRLRAMTPDLCRPYSRLRAGMQLGEAAAFLVLEREDDAILRGARMLATVESLGLSCDAFHPTRPLADGSGMAASMIRALEGARISPEAVGWVCGHGSGTSASDAAEIEALRRVFGERPPPLTGLKGALGHSLGAATAVEAAITVLALHHRILPPTANGSDPEAGVDVVQAPRPAPDLQYALNCGYAFGGLNASLLLGAAS